MADDWKTKTTTTTNADETDTVDTVAITPANDNDALGTTPPSSSTDSWQSGSLSDTGTTGALGASSMSGSAQDTGLSGLSDTTPPADSDMPGYTAGGMASDTNGASGSLKEQAAQKGHELLEKGKETAGQAIDRAKTEVKSKLTDQKERATDTLESATEALQGTSQQFRDQNLGIVADYTESFAGQVRRVSEYLREKDMDELGRDVETFAKQNPAVFIGGAFLIGVAVARFLRSSESPSPMDAFSRSNSRALMPAGTSAIAVSDTEDAFGKRPLTAHNYVPGYGVSS